MFCKCNFKESWELLLHIMHISTHLLRCHLVCFLGHRSDRKRHSLSPKVNTELLVDCTTQLWQWQGGQALTHTYTQVASRDWSALMAGTVVFRRWCKSWLRDINKEWKRVCVCVCVRQRITDRILDLSLPSPTVSSVFIPLLSVLELSSFSLLNLHSSHLYPKVMKLLTIFASCST